MAIGHSLIVSVLRSNRNGRFMTGTIGRTPHGCQSKPKPRYRLRIFGRLRGNCALRGRTRIGHPILAVPNAARGGKGSAGTYCKPPVRIPESRLVMHGKLSRSRVFPVRSLERVEVALFDFRKGFGIGFHLSGDRVPERGQCGSRAGIVSDSVPFVGGGKFGEN